MSSSFLGMFVYVVVVALRGGVAAFAVEMEVLVFVVAILSSFFG